eukprot:14323708-Alexandrium_andersonii.AAC.1
MAKRLRIGCASREPHSLGAPEILQAHLRARRKGRRSAVLVHSTGTVEGTTAPLPWKWGEGRKRPPPFLFAA